MAAGFPITIKTGELRRYVVQLLSENHAMLGTGFFVAPSWVLTCAHVLRGAAKAIVAPHPAISATPVAATVDAASPPPDDHSTQLWPFPDLALLHLDERLEHPCALLDDHGPVGGPEWQAWGYSEREPGVTPIGSPASFRYEGEEADGYLKLKGGEAAPGLSGAPLVCPRRRAVVAVVAATREPHSDKGAYAVPVFPLLTGDERVPRILARHGAFVKDMNLPCVLEGGRVWSRVLDVQNADQALQKTWTTFTKSAGSSPSDLLRAEFGIVPYLFRKRAIDEAIAWCDQETPLAIARISGRGGAGKTRFALELCRSLRERGWLAGLWRGDRSCAGVPLPRLVVVDYAETEELHLALDDALADLQSSASPIAPVRLLFLTRTAADGRLPGQMPGLTPAVLVTAVGSTWDIDGVSTALGMPERAGLYNAAVEAFTDAWYPVPSAGPRPAGSRPEPPDLSAERYAAPLEVLFEALDSALSGAEPVRNPDRTPVERVLDHERKYWHRANTQLDHGLQESVAALATLAGADSEEEAHELLAVLPTLRGEVAEYDRCRYIAWLNRLYDGPGRLNPVRPDRLGEALVSLVIRKQPDGGRALLEGLISLSSDAQVAHCLDVLARLITAEVAGQRAATAGANSLGPVRDALNQCIGSLEERARTAGDPAQPVNPIAPAYNRLIEALRLAERQQELQQREAIASGQIADERAREEKARQDYSDSLTQRDQVFGRKVRDRAKIRAIAATADPAAAHEQGLIDQRIQLLETELAQMRQAREDTEAELHRLRSERTENDKLLSLKRHLEEELHLQIEHTRREQRQREKAEQEGDFARRQRDTQFEWARHEESGREKAERTLKATQSQLAGLRNEITRLRQTRPSSVFATVVFTAVLTALAIVLVTWVFTILIG